MKRRAWRIVQQQQADTAFDGKDARLYGGRWNYPGTPLVYTTATRFLELLVNLHETSQLENYVFIPVDFSEALVKKKRHAHLPKDWRDSPPSDTTKDLGTQWTNTLAAAILEVPSAVVPGESNYILNPIRPDYKKIKIGKLETIEFDPRLQR